MFKYLFVFALIIIPFSSIYDSFLWTLAGVSGKVGTSIIFRLLDDVLLCIIFIVLFYKSKLNYKYVWDLNRIYICLIIITFFSIVVSSFFIDFRIIISGLKWFLTIVLLGFFVFLNMDETEFIHNKIVYFLIIFLYLNILFQIVQLNSFISYFGPGLFGFSQRTIGFFKEANTLAFFNIITFYYIYFYMNNNLHKKVILFLLLPLSIIFSGSITAFMTLLIIILHIIFNFRSRKLFAIVVVVIFYFFAPHINIRPGLENSIYDRLDIILNSISVHNILFSSNFGLGTNEAVMLNLSSLIPESTIASLLINIGVVGTFLFYLLFTSIINNKQGIIFSLCILTMSLTNIIFSAYPINLLFAFEFAYLLKLQNKNIKGV